MKNRIYNDNGTVEEVDLITSTKTSTTPNKPPQAPEWTERFDKVWDSNGFLRHISIPKSIVVDANKIKEFWNKELELAYQKGIQKGKEEERLRVIDEMQKIEDLSADEERAKWADHCSCLRYAIDVIKNPESQRMAYASEALTQKDLSTTKEEKDV